MTLRKYLKKLILDGYRKVSNRFTESAKMMVHWFACVIIKRKSQKTFEIFGLLIEIVISTLILITFVLKYRLSYIEATVRTKEIRCFKNLRITFFRNGE